MLHIIANNAIGAGILVGSCLLLPIGEWVAKKFEKKSKKL